MKRVRLEKRRLQLGYTQQQVADAVKIDRTVYSRIECGKREPSLTVARRIAEFLGADINIFFNSDVLKQHVNAS